MIFALFGDFLLGRVDEIWTSDLLYLMGLLDISERAVRLTLSRMTKKGWLVAGKHGRRSHYSLSERGRDLLIRGRNRIFEPVTRGWDGQWHMLVYSLPEKLRSIRHALRTQLSWLGFGSLSPGIWISPHDRMNEIEGIVSELEITSRVNLFTSTYLGPSTPQSLVEQCWDLSNIESQYRKFVYQYREEYEKLLNGGDRLGPEKSFIRQFWLTHSFQSFPLKDPNLPTELLPNNWMGIAARELFDNYHQLLSDSANRFVNDVLKEKKQKRFPPLSNDLSVPFLGARR